MKGPFRVMKKVMSRGDELLGVKTTKRGDLSNAISSIEEFWITLAQWGILLLIIAFSLQE